MPGEYRVIGGDEPGPRDCLLVEADAGQTIDEKKRRAVREDALDLFPAPRQGREVLHRDERLASVQLQERVVVHRRAIAAPP